MVRFAQIALFVSVLSFLGCGDVLNTPTSPTIMVCDFVFSPSKIVASSLPQRVVVQVKTGNSCHWTATAADSWINIVYQGSSGTGDLIFNLDRNQCTSMARIGFIGIKDSTTSLEIFQDGSDLDLCPKTIF